MSKIYGVPFVLIGLIVFIVVPLAAFDVVILRSINDVKTSVAVRPTPAVVVPTEEVTPTVTPSPTPFKQVVPQRPATSSGEAGK